MSQAARPTRRPPRWGRRILLIFLCLALLAGGAIVALLWFSSTALDNLMAELDRDDPGWRLEEIEAKRKSIPDKRNAALQILAVRRLQGATGVVITETMQPAFENLPPQVQLNGQQMSLLSSQFAAMGKAVPEARKLKDMPEGRFPTKFTPDFISTPLDCQEARAVAELLYWDAAVRAQNLDADGALESCLALHHTARAIGDKPMLVALYVRYAGNAVTVSALERTLAQATFTSASDAALVRLQKALGDEMAEPRFLSVVRGERAGAHQFFQAVAQGKAAAPSTWHIPGFRQYHHIAVLRFHTKIVNAARLGPEDADKELEALDKNMQQESFWVRTLALGIAKMKSADRRSQAQLRCAQAALAAERFRIAKERWPDSLDELVKTGLLEAIPMDPFDYKPIRLKRTADGHIFYSVGPDKTDNGGTIDRDNPTDPGKDLGFQLWDVSARRQPPNQPVAGIELKGEGR